MILVNVRNPSPLFDVEEASLPQLTLVSSTGVNGVYSLPVLLAFPYSLRRLMNSHRSMIVADVGVVRGWVACRAQASCSFQL